MKKRGGIDLAPGGPSWEGFRFQSYGRAAEWRLITPEGEALTAAELLQVRAQAHSLAYLQGQVIDLTSRLAGSTASWSPDESHLIRVALQLLLREMPAQLGRRDAAVSPARLLQAVK